MKKTKLAGIFLGLFTFGAAAAAGTFPSQAAVRSIRLNVEDQYETGVILEPEITSESYGIRVEEVEWSREAEKWKPGASVTGIVTLSSDEEFSSSYGARSVKIHGASFTSAKKEGDVLEVKFSYKPVVQLDSPEEAGWSGMEKTKASWKSVKYATGYDIRLYRDDRYVKTIEATTNSKDLKEYMDQEGYYYYEVRATGRDADDRRYRVRSEYIMSSDKILDDLGETGGRWRNYSGGRKYQREDGTYPANQWEKIVGDWYYFDGNGYATTGWQCPGGVWYYMNQDGVMQTGWILLNGVWYYLNPNGDMAVGWKETEPGKWYYLNPDGSMAANTVIDGKQLDGTGLMID